MLRLQTEPGTRGIGFVTFAMSAIEKISAIELHAGFVG